MVDLYKVDILQIIDNVRILITLITDPHIMYNELTVNKGRIKKFHNQYL